MKMQDDGCRIQANGCNRRLVANAACPGAARFGEFVQGLTESHAMDGRCDLSLRGPKDIVPVLEPCVHPDRVRVNASGHVACDRHQVITN
jgi:hypothetical protein